MVVKANRLKHILRSGGTSKLAFLTQAAVATTAVALLYGFVSAASSISRGLDTLSIETAQSIVSPDMLSSVADMLLLLGICLSTVMLVSLTATCLSANRAAIAADRELIKAQLTLGMTPREIFRRYLAGSLLCSAVSTILGITIGALAVEASLLSAIEAELSLSGLRLGFSWLGAIVCTAVCAAIFLLTALSVRRRSIANRSAATSDAKLGALRFLPKAVRAAVIDPGSTGCTIISIVGCTAAFICLAAVGLASSSRLLIVCTLLCALAETAVLLCQCRADLKLRSRELAAMRIGGFSPKMLKAFVFRGKLLLSLLGIIPGCALAFPLGWLTLSIVRVGTVFTVGELSPIAVLGYALACAAAASICNLASLRSLDELTKP